MGRNVHNIEKNLRGDSLGDLTGKAEGGTVDIITQLKHTYDTTNNSQIKHAIEKTIQEYNKSLAHMLGEEFVFSEFQTDPFNAGLRPQGFTGFFDNKVNKNLFDFFSKDTDGFFYSMRRLNADYTGYACKVYRSYDNALGSVEFDANGIVSTGSKVTVLPGDEGFGSGFKYNVVDGVPTRQPYTTSRTGTLFDFYERTHTGFIGSGYGGIETLYPQRTDGMNESGKFRSLPKSDSFTTNFGNLYYEQSDDDISNVTWTIYSGHYTSKNRGLGKELNTNNFAEDKVHPIWTGTYNNERYWFYRHNFTDGTNNVAPFGSRWAIVKSSTWPGDNTSLSSGSGQLRAYSDSIPGDEDQNRPFGETVNWTVRASGSVSADATPRETLNFSTKIVSNDPTRNYDVSSQRRLPMIHGPSNRLFPHTFTGSQVTGVIIPSYDHFNQKGHMRLTETPLDLRSGSMIFVARVDSMTTTVSQIVYTSSTAAGNIDRAEPVILAGETDTIFQGKDYQMRFGNNSINRYNFSGLVSAGEDFSGTYKEGIESHLQRGPFTILEMHNVQEANGEANEFYFQNAKSPLNVSKSGTPASYKETGRLSTGKHYVGSTPSYNNPFDGTIPEWIFFRTDPKNLQEERQRYVNSITGFYDVPVNKEGHEVYIRNTGSSITDYNLNLVYQCDQSVTGLDYNDSEFTSNARIVTGPGVFLTPQYEYVTGVPTSGSVYFKIFHVGSTIQGNTGSFKNPAGDISGLTRFGYTDEKFAPNAPNAATLTNGTSVNTGDRVGSCVFELENITNDVLLTFHTELVS